MCVCQKGYKSENCQPETGTSMVLTGNMTGNPMKIMYELLSLNFNY